MSDDPQDPNEPTPAEAFDSTHHFAGRPLAPFSFARQTAFQRLGVGSASALESAAALVFLCLSEPDRIDRARGADGCAEYRLEMQRWADKQKIGIAYTDPKTRKKHGSKAGHEVMAISDRIWLEIAISESEPDIPTGGEAAPPNAPCRAGKRPTSPKSRQS